MRVPNHLENFMIHSLILSDRRNNQYKTLGILIFIIYPYIVISVHSERYF